MYQISTIKQIGEKSREKKFRVHVGFIGLENVYDRLIGSLCGKC